MDPTIAAAGLSAMLTSLGLFKKRNRNKKAK
ncbi:LPXTG cell wall anchor domain-containing protein [Enterococcus asini]